MVGNELAEVIFVIIKLGGVEMVDLVVMMSNEDKKRLLAGGGYSSKDGRNAVKRVCMQNSIPYKDCFVSIGVFVGNIPHQNVIFSYGEVTAYLKPNLINEIEIVSNTDLQDYCCNFNSKVKNGHYHKIPNGNVFILEEAFKNRLSLERYAEARIFRELTCADIQRFE